MSLVALSVAVIQSDGCQVSLCRGFAHRPQWLSKEQMESVNSQPPPSGRMTAGAVA